MPENNTNSQDNSTSQSDAAAQTYPARDANNGEEQRNRLGYMATEPTDDEIEEGEEKPDEVKDESKPGVSAPTDK